MSMNNLLKKKINLLIHLAKVDGKFDDSERQILRDMLEENGLSSYENVTTARVDLTELKDIPNKHDILYWAIKMVKADNILHADEISFCKSLATTLGFESAIIDRFIHEHIASADDFAKMIAGWKKTAP